MKVSLAGAIRRCSAMRERSIVVRPPGPLGELGTLLSAIDQLRASADVSSLVRRTVEVARSHIGLERVSVFLVDPTRAYMLGTWGTDLDGQIVAEHQLSFEIGRDVVDAFLRAEKGGQPFTVLDGCPMVVPLANGARVAGRGWVACTPIRSPRARVGIMYNNAGLSRAPVDDCRQARAALLCAALGDAVELARSLPHGVPIAMPTSAKHAALKRAIGLLSRDPTLSSQALAASAGISQRQLSQLFRSELGVSLSTYRNRLRIEKLQMLLDEGGHSLSEAARSVGFGSYAQFHRVFYAAYGVGPRAYMRTEHG